MWLLDVHVRLHRSCRRTVDPAGSYVRLLASRMYERSPWRAHGPQATAAGTLEVRCPATACFHHFLYHIRRPYLQSLTKCHTCAGPPVGWLLPSAFPELQRPLCARQHEQGVQSSTCACTPALEGLAALCTQFTLRETAVSYSQAKAKITSIVWTPEGRRCIIGSQRGEFTIWGGTSFTYDTALQVHSSRPTGGEHYDDALTCT